MNFQNLINHINWPVNAEASLQEWVSRRRYSDSEWIVCLDCYLISVNFTNFENFIQPQTTPTPNERGKGDKRSRTASKWCSFISQYQNYQLYTFCKPWITLFRITLYYIINCWKATEVKRFWECSTELGIQITSFIFILLFVVCVELKGSSPSKKAEGVNERYRWGLPQWHLVLTYFAKWGSKKPKYLIKDTSCQGNYR